MKTKMTRVTKSGQVDKRFAPMMSRTVSYETFIRRLQSKSNPNKDIDRRLYQGHGFCMECGSKMSMTNFIRSIIDTDNPDEYTFYADTQCQRCIDSYV